MISENVLSVFASVFYAMLLLTFVFLAAVSWGEEVPAYARDPPAGMPVRRMAAFLYRKLCEYRTRRRKQGKDLRIPGEERVRSDLAILYPSLKAGREEVLYRITCIERILLLFLAGLLLAGALHIKALGGGVLQEDGSIPREPAEGPDRQVSVEALPGGEAGAGMETAQQDAAYGTFQVTIHARQYTRQEAAAMAREIFGRFPDSLLGKNKEPGEIRYPLTLPLSAQTAPFAVNWESSRYSVLDTDGSIFNSEYAEDQKENVSLTAVLTYADYRFEKKMDFTVQAPVRDEAQKLYGEIGGALARAEKETAAMDSCPLPLSVAGRTILWKEKVEDPGGGVLFLFLLLCLSVWFVTDQRLHDTILRRNRQLAVDYPQLISKIVLYLGAGMSMRNIFYTCAARYREKQAAGAGRRRIGRGKMETRYLYEEILLVCNELDSGVPEAEAYMHFGKRCRSRQYTKLCSLLVQNLKRGNDALLEILQEEAQSSFEERKNLARELGEEAGTKLLLPMMLSLGVTMLMIIVPAYFGFSL